MESLHKWSKLLGEHVKKLNLPESKRDEFARRQYRAFQTYLDPDESTTTSLTSPAIAANKATSAQQQQPGGSVSASASNTDVVDHDDVNGVLLPLDPFILSKNIGLPIAVIVTKV